MRIDRSIETPAVMHGRPIDHRGFPVPWFVTEKDDRGRWDFAAIQSDRFVQAVREDRCWVSGEKLGKWRSFVIGPMCVVNRVSSDPPVRREVGIWSAQICPFLTRPMAQRDRRWRDEVDEDGIFPGQRGVMLAQNPGICAVYSTRDVRFDRRRHLFFLGDPGEVRFFCEGREATPEEVWRAVDRGLVKLRKMAEEDGPGAVGEFERYVERARSVLPPRSEAVVS